MNNRPYKACLNHYPNFHLKADEKKNQLVPIPHPEFAEDWPTTLALSIENLLLLH